MDKRNKKETINKKGYSLIELIVVIALIALILLLFAPKVVSIVNDFSDNRFKELVMRNAEAAAKNYVSDNKYENVIANEIKDQCNISGNNSAIIKIKIKELINNNYLEATKAIKKGIIDEDSDVIEIEYNCETKKFISYKYGESTIKSIDLTYLNTNAEFEVTSSSITSYYTVIMKEKTADYIDLSKSSCFATLKNSSSDPINGILELDPSDNTSNNYKCTINALKNDTDYDISVNFVTTQDYSKERIDTKKTLNITAPKFISADECNNTSMIYNIEYDRVFYHIQSSNIQSEINLQYYFKIEDGAANFITKENNTVFKCDAGNEGYKNCSSTNISSQSGFETGYWYKISKTSFMALEDNEYYLYKIYINGFAEIRTLIYDGTNVVGISNSSIDISEEDYSTHYETYKPKFSTGSESERNLYTSRIEAQFTKPSNNCNYTYVGEINPYIENTTSNYLVSNNNDLMVYDLLEDNTSYDLKVCAKETKTCSTITLETPLLNAGSVNSLSKTYNPGTLLTAELEFSNINDGSLYSRDENYVMITDSSNNIITKYVGNQLLNQQFQLSSSIDTKLQFTLFDGVNLATSGFDIWFGKNQELDGNPITYTNTIIAKYKKSSDYEHITNGKCFYALGTDFSNALEGLYDKTSNTCTFTKLTQNTIYNIKLVTTFDDGATKDSITNGVVTKSIVATTINNSNYIEYPNTNMYDLKLQERYIKFDTDYTLSNNTSLADCGKGENPTNCSSYSSILSVLANTWYKINLSTIFSEKENYVGIINTINSDGFNNTYNMYYLNTKESSAEQSFEFINSSVGISDFIDIRTKFTKNSSYSASDETLKNFSIKGGGGIKVITYINDYFDKKGIDNYEMISAVLNYDVKKTFNYDSCVKKYNWQQDRTCKFVVELNFNNSIIIEEDPSEFQYWGYIDGIDVKEGNLPYDAISYQLYPSGVLSTIKDVTIIDYKKYVTGDGNPVGAIYFDNIKYNFSAYVYGTYDISTGASSGGTITPNGLNHLSNGSSEGIYISIVANEGYRVKNVIVNGVSVGSVNRIYIYRPSSNYTINATFEKIS